MRLLLLLAWLLAAAPPPSGARVVETADTAVLIWQQQSDATVACVEQVQGVWSRLGCMDSAAGPQRFPVPLSGASFYIHEYHRHLFSPQVDDYGVFGPFRAQPRIFFAIIR